MFSIKGIDARLQQSITGRAFRQAGAEAVGFSYQGGFAGEGKRMGWLGISGSREKYAAAKRAAGGSLTKTAMAKSAVGALGTAAFAALPAAFTLSETYAGYQEGGVFGAIKGASTSIAMGGLFNTAAAVLGGTAPLMAIGAGAFGYHAFGEAAQAHTKNLSRLEMGNTAIDALGSAGAATMRQRSMSALQNTHINGRVALGQEASIMHSTFR
jgi:hypothetical protein